MANSRDSSSVNHEYATVDSAPSSSGYFTNAVYPRKNKINKLFFSIRESVDGATSAITISLQFKCSNDAAWQDCLNNGSAWATGDRVIIDEFGEGVAWRAGVKNAAAYTSGSLTFGFEW